MSTQAFPSPPVSAVSPSASTRAGLAGTANLPTPRQHPLRPGSQKEIALINYVDDKLLSITRKYGKKFSNSIVDADDAPGYTTFEQVISDIDPLLDVVWISGTSSLQIPYLLTFAGLLCSYMPAFPFSPAVFRLVNKIDLAFVSLLQPPHTDPNSSTSNLPVSTTEKVRIKSLVEETRVVAVQAASSSGHSASVQELSSDDETETEYETDLNGGGASHSSDNIAIGLSRIYKRTLEILGDSLT